MRLLFVLLLLALLDTGVARAHEVRPALLEITEGKDGRADMLWKQPTQGEVAVSLHPRVSGGVFDRPPDRVQSAPGFAIARWHDVALGEQGMSGRTITIEGLTRTITDTLVVVHRAKGDTVEQILTPAEPSFVVDGHGGVEVLGYLRLGTSHILTGVDHLLFVLGLILLSANVRTLVQTITAFTLAHSITLALTALRLVSINPSLVEAMVAFSILFLAVELVRKQRGKHGLTLRYPWIVAFCFGLLHGAAFAGALREVGLPENNIPAALFLFNVGVEVGQLLFVLVVEIALRTVRYLPLPARSAVLTETLATYAIGSFSAYWFFERLQIAFNA